MIKIEKTLEIEGTKYKLILELDEDLSSYKALARGFPGALYEEKEDGFGTKYWAQISYQRYLPLTLAVLHFGKTV